MSDLSSTNADRAENADSALKGNSFELPEPPAEWWPASSSRSLREIANWFDPERWDVEQIQRQPNDDRDPVTNDAGRVESRKQAALFLSDFHLGDGSAGGDDFLESHMERDEELGLYTGFFPAGESRAKLVASVLAFALRRLEAVRGAQTRLDLVLNGDVINFLELRGRGGMLVSPKHRPLFQTLASVAGRADVYWLRGNHDYVVPSGPWQAGVCYVNPTLQTLAEHGDFWDKENWPPGPDNKGSRLVIQAAAAFEVHSAVMKDGTVKYLMSGVDNIRPWSNDALEAFLDRRSKHSNVAWLAALMSRLRFVGAADDAAAYRGALERRRAGPYADWLMVQGHTHVPAAMPGVYYNTGSWISTLITAKGKETHLDVFPFLLVYQDAAGQRVEEYYTTTSNRDASTARVQLETPASIDKLREEFGYKKLKA